MPIPVSLTVISTCEVHPLEPDLDAAVSFGELHGVRQQIPENLLQTLWIARHRRGAEIHDRLESHALGVGCRPHRLHGLLNERGQVDGLQVQAKLARHDARHVEHILDDLGQGRDVPRHRVDRAGLFLAGQQSRLHHADVADNRVQRRPQLVRERREELVLQPACVPGDRQQPVPLLLGSLPVADVAGDLRRADHRAVMRSESARRSARRESECRPFGGERSRSGRRGRRA